MALASGLQGYVELCWLQQHTLMACFSRTTAGTYTCVTSGVILAEAEGSHQCQKLVTGSSHLG